MPPPRPLVGFLVVLSLLSCSCRPEPTSTLLEPPLQPTPGLPWFEDVAAARGLTFQHFDPATPMHTIQETLGSGLGWIDYDADGHPDLFCVQDGPIRPVEGQRPTNKLFRNNGDGTFTDVTQATGLARSGYGLGCAVGDFDNDGFDDLVVTYLGGLVLYHNVAAPGGRRFEDVTAQAGLSNPHFGTSCGWGDVNNDGWLDLYVCNYVEFDLDHYPLCQKPGADPIRHTCSPTTFPTVAHKLFLGKGRGTFEDASQTWGLTATRTAPGLAVLLLDLDDDGWLDIYVANDLKTSYLFHNQAGKRFVDVGTTSGAGLNVSGGVMSGMGIDAADVDGCGRPSLFVTNYQRQPNILFRNRGRLQFQDAAVASGLGPPSLSRLAFGTVFLDADRDGHQDVAIANGHVFRNADVVEGTEYAQQAQFFVGDGQGKFRDASAKVGAYFLDKVVGRGVARADFDNDGRIDLAFSHIGGPVALLRNATTNDHHWLRLELEGDGQKSNRNAFGARVEIEADGRRQVHWLAGGGSYLSASDRRMLIGLGSATKVERVTVRWPSGNVQKFGPLEVDRGHRLREGQP